MMKKLAICGLFALLIGATIIAFRQDSPHEEMIRILQEINKKTTPPTTHLSRGLKLLSTIHCLKNQAIVKINTSYLQKRPFCLKLVKKSNP